MRVAVISDIHGNLASLEAVLANIDAVEAERAVKLDEQLARKRAEREAGNSGIAQPQSRRDQRQRPGPDEVTSLSEPEENLNEKLEATVCLGDMVGHAAHPNEVLDLLRDRKVEMVRGNYDEAAVGLRDATGADYASTREQEADRAAVRWTAEHLTAENAQFLKVMRTDARLQVTRSGRQLGPIRETPDPSKGQRSNILTGFFVGGAVARMGRSPRQIQPRTLLFVHGSPRDVVEYLYPGTATSILNAIAGGAKADMIIHGHSHLAYHRVAGSVAFVGVGSVGRSRTGGQAEYSILEIAGKDIDVETHIVAYDVEREIRDLDSSGLPRELAEVLRSGSFPHPNTAAVN
ncbi:MAG TPA: metallophosphoesterase family protein [Chloroflexota bacterium]|jgi:predicted phosphodiesterase|nr:metallophosphoesterase family protein [Chloroflexota bacterium]